MAENFTHFAKKKTAKLLPENIERTAKIQLEQTQFAIWWKSATLNIPLNPVFAKKQANEGRNLTLIVSMNSFLWIIHVI